MTPDRAGFSLVEATIAMTISTVLVLAVGSVFIAQSTFYSRLNGDALAQDQARAFVSQITEAVASMVDGGILVADSLNFVVRRPQTLALVCHVGGAGNGHSHLSAGIDAVDDSDAAGLAKLDRATGVWTYQSGNVSSATSLEGSTPAQRCQNNSGTDTTGAYDDFMRLDNLNSWFGSPAVEGDVYMIYEEIEYELAESVLDTRVWGLYRGIYGETLSEVVGTLDSLAYFEYRVSGVWSTSVSGGGLTDIDAVRVHAASRAPVGADGEDATFELTIDIPVRN